MHHPQVRGEAGRLRERDATRKREQAKEGKIGASKREDEMRVERKVGRYADTEEERHPRVALLRVAKL